ncbi:MAG TPA: DUF6496 domain-containing protein [Dongiaceae bacterium]|nr:DUF6496 domain-containing protein [Dongiaceae bacterium]
MPKSTPRQRKSIGRVMHEYEHGELKRGRRGKGGKVKNRRQAIAIALNEAGASKYNSARRNTRNLRRTEHKEARGRTAQQEREGKSHVGATGRRESSRAMGGTNERRLTKRGRKSAAGRTRHAAHGATKKALYRRAQRAGIEGRSKMTKQQLANALHA